MAFGGRWWRLTRSGGLALALVAGVGPVGVRTASPSPSSQQEPSPSQADDETTRVVSPEALEKIRGAVENEPTANLNLDLTFYLRIVRQPPTFADYLAKAPPGWADITPIVPPSSGIGRGPSPAFQTIAGAGGGIDLLGIFRAIGRANQEREAQRIRRQIDIELAAFDELAPSAPPADNAPEPESEATEDE